VGPSGCGKSTLLKCIAGLETVSAGRIVVAGKTVDKPADHLGVVFQRDVLFDWRTVLDNVLISAEFQKFRRASMIERARRLLEMVGLKGYEDRYP
jgi:NitT/TauT family transport system ATP-binding protein